MLKNFKTILLLMMASCMIIYVAACKKSGPTQASIVGAWTFSSLEEKLFISHALAFDTTISASSYTGAVAFDFGADGFYTEISAHGSIGSAYTYSNNVLSLFDTSVGSRVWSRLPVSSLTDHTFVIADTISTGHDSVSVILESFTR